jgi:predicted nucleotidyltransferase
MTCGELSLRVPSIEGMIALKLHAMRNQAERRIRDTQDIQTILRRPGSSPVTGKT